MNDEKVFDSLDRVIDDLRKKKLYEEAKLLEEQRIEARKKKKFQEMHDRKKNKAKNAGAELQTYDLSGKAVDVVNLNALPNITPKCIKGSETVRDDKPIYKEIPKIERLLKRVSTLNELQLRNTIKEQGGVLKYPTGAYDTFVPAVGVTFTEAGKNPKSMNTTISQQMGRITKSEFRTMITEYSFGNTVAYLPGVNKNKNTIISARMPVFHIITIESESMNISKSQLPQISVPSKGWMDKTSNESVSMSADLSVLLVDNMESALYNPASLSVLPKAYYLATKKNEDLAQYPGEPGVNDLFNLNMELMEMTGMGSGVNYGTIKKPEKSTSVALKQIQKRISTRLC